MLAHSSTEGRCRFSGLWFHSAGEFRQPKLGPAATGLTLLLGQPVTQRGDEVVVGELI